MQISNLPCFLWSFFAQVCVVLVVGLLVFTIVRSNRGHDISNLTPSLSWFDAQVCAAAVVFVTIANSSAMVDTSGQTRPCAIPSEVRIWETGSVFLTFCSVALLRVRGIFGLARRFRLSDDDKSGSISFHEFQVCCVCLL